LLPGWGRGQRTEFRAEDAATGTRLGRVGRVGPDLRQPGTAEIGYWTDARARNRGVTTSAVRAANPSPILKKFSFHRRVSAS
jgi:RimJ/RimL family protein N-acetyltransferase